MKTEPSERIQQHIRNVDRWPRKAGKADLRRFLDGQHITRAEAINARCYDCTQGQDTKPCGVETCPLLPYCPYGAAKPPDPS